MSNIAQKVLATSLATAGLALAASGIAVCRDAYVVGEVQKLHAQYPSFPEVRRLHDAAHELTLKVDADHSSHLIGGNLSSPEWYRAAAYDQKANELMPRATYNTVLATLNALQDEHTKLRNYLNWTVGALGISLLTAIGVSSRRNSPDHLSDDRDVEIMTRDSE